MKQKVNLRRIARFRSANRIKLLSCTTCTGFPPDLPAGARQSWPWESPVNRQVSNLLSVDWSLLLKPSWRRNLCLTSPSPWPLRRKETPPLASHGVQQPGPLPWIRVRKGSLSFASLRKRSLYPTNTALTCNNSCCPRGSGKSCMSWCLSCSAVHWLSWKFSSCVRHQDWWTHWCCCAW